MFSLIHLASLLSLSVSSMYFRGKLVDQDEFRSMISDAPQVEDPVKNLYRFNLSDFETILSFVDNLDDFSMKIVSYTALADAVKEAQFDVNSRLIVLIIHAKSIVENYPCGSATSENKNKFDELMLRFPQWIKDIVFEEVYIESLSPGYEHYAIFACWNEDRVCISYSDYDVESRKRWKFEHVRNDWFRIRNIYRTSYYLDYWDGAGDGCNEPADRVCTSRYSNRLWKIRPTGNGYNLLSDRSDQVYYSRCRLYTRARALIWKNSDSEFTNERENYWDIVPKKIDRPCCDRTGWNYFRCDCNRCAPPNNKLTILGQWVSVCSVTANGECSVTIKRGATNTMTNTWERRDKQEFMKSVEFGLSFQYVANYNIKIGWTSSHSLENVKGSISSHTQNWEEACTVRFDSDPERCHNSILWQWKVKGPHFDVLTCDTAITCTREHQPQCLPGCCANKHCSECLDNEPCKINEIPPGVKPYNT